MNFTFTNKMQDDNLFAMKLFISVFVMSFLFFSVSGCQTYDNSSLMKNEALNYQNEGRTSQNSNDWDRAISSYKKAFYIDPYNPKILNDLGIAYEHKKLYNRAEESYKKAIATDKSYLASYYNLAHLYEKAGQIDKALYYYKLRVKLAKDKNDPWAWKAKNKIYFYEKNSKSQN